MRVNVLYLCVHSSLFATNNLPVSSSFPFFFLCISQTLFVHFSIFATLTIYIRFRSFFYRWIDMCAFVCLFVFTIGWTGGLFLARVLHIMCVCVHVYVLYIYLILEFEQQLCCSSSLEPLASLSLSLNCFHKNFSQKHLQTILAFGLFNLVTKHHTYCWCAHIHTLAHPKSKKKQWFCLCVFLTHTQQ